MTNIETGRENAREMWEKVLTLIPEGEEVRGSSQALADKMEVSTGRVRAALQLFRKLDMMAMRTEYEWQKQIVSYKRLVGRERGIALLEGHFNLGRGLNYYKDIAPSPRRKANNVTADADITVAIVGEDAPKPMESLREIRRDEPEALIEAARQYATREQAVIEHIGALEALGITIDHDQMAKAIKTENDPILDAVAQLLPIFDRGQRAIERLSVENQNLRHELKDARHAANEATKELLAHKDANKRLSERNTALTGQLTELRSVAHA